MRSELKPRMRGLLMDLNFHGKGIIREIRADFGAEAVIFVQQILFALAAEPGGKMKEHALCTLGDENHISRDNSKRILEILLGASSPWLFKDSGGYLYSDRIKAEQDRYLRRCKVNKKVANERYTKRARIVQRKVHDSIDIDNDNDNDLSLIKNKNGKLKFLNHIWLTQREHEQLLGKFGQEFFDRLCDKLDSWIEQSKDAGGNLNPKRVKNGKNAAATFRSWVISAVAEEQQRAKNGKTKLAPSSAGAEAALNFLRG